MPKVGKSAKYPLMGSAVNAVPRQVAVGSAVTDTATRKRLLIPLLGTSTIVANQRCDAGSKKILGSLTPVPEGIVTPALAQKDRSVLVCTRAGGDFLKTEKRPLINSTT